LAEVSNGSVLSPGNFIGPNGELGWACSQLSSVGASFGAFGGFEGFHCTVVVFFGESMVLAIDNFLGGSARRFLLAPVFVRESNAPNDSVVEPLRSPEYFPVPGDG
jgi:hypothetical protein